MDDHDAKPPQLFINGVDLSAFVKDGTISGSVERDDSPFGGPYQETAEMVTLTGYWDDGRVTCGNCGERFMPGPEGTPTITQNPAGIGLAFVACPACAVAVLELNRDGG